MPCGCSGAPARLTGAIVPLPLPPAGVAAHHEHLGFRLLALLLLAQLLCARYPWADANASELLGSKSLDLLEGNRQINDDIVIRVQYRYFIVLRFALSLGG